MNVQPRFCRYLDPDKAFEVEYNVVIRPSSTNEHCEQALHQINHQRTPSIRLDTINDKLLIQNAQITIG